jgi:hypothetical protein
MGLGHGRTLLFSTTFSNRRSAFVAGKVRLPPKRIEEARCNIYAVTRRVTPIEWVDVISDLSDNRIVEWARAAGSAFSVTDARCWKRRSAEAGGAVSLFAEARMRRGRI